MKTNSKKTTKLQFRTTDGVWNEVLKFKINRNLGNNNEAVEELITKGLQPIDNEDRDILCLKEIVPNEDTFEIIKEFREAIPLLEKKEKIPLIILKDGKSGAFYCECHMNGSDFVKLSDRDATIDPELQEEFRANRELEPDNYYFHQMIEDAKGGRQFSDLVLEYNTEYRERKPMKILGGQHRTEAIKEALNQKIDVVHGIKIYFNLDKDQRAEIMRISNTNINVSPDLRDRIEENRLKPILREFCKETGILKEGDDFGDKKRLGEEFSPTVRMMRSFFVNFFKGVEYGGEDIYADAVVPHLCKSGGKIDNEYYRIYKKFEVKNKFDHEGLLTASKMFAKLHDTQFKNADRIQGTAKREFKIKAFSLSVITSWAFTSGILQGDEEKLKKFYSLPNLAEKDDPLNASAMSRAKHKTIDPETYRGLGTRNDNKERGRLLQLFLHYAASEKEKITIHMCNAAIEVFHSNEARIRAEEKLKKAF